MISTCQHPPGAAFCRTAEAGTLRGTDPSLIAHSSLAMRGTGFISGLHTIFLVVDLLGNSYLAESTEWASRRLAAVHQLYLGVVPGSMQSWPVGSYEYAIMQIKLCTP